AALQFDLDHPGHNSYMRKTGNAGYESRLEKKSAEERLQVLGELRALLLPEADGAKAPRLAEQGEEAPRHVEPIVGEGAEVCRRAAEKVAATVDTGFEALPSAPAKHQSALPAGADAVAELRAAGEDEVADRFDAASAWPFGPVAETPVEF